MNVAKAIKRLQEADKATIGEVRSLHGWCDDLWIGDQVRLPNSYEQGVVTRFFGVMYYVRWDRDREIRHWRDELILISEDEIPL